MFLNHYVLVFPECSVREYQRSIFGWLVAVRKLNHQRLLRSSSSAIAPTFRTTCKMTSAPTRTPNPKSISAIEILLSCIFNSKLRVAIALHISSRNALTIRRMGVVDKCLLRWRRQAKKRSSWCNVNTFPWCRARTILRRHVCSVTVVIAINFNICPTWTIGNICKHLQACDSYKLFHISSISYIPTPLYWLLNLQIWFRDDEELHEELAFALYLTQNNFYFFKSSY